MTYDIEPLYYQIKAEIIDAKTKKSPKTWHSQCRVKVATQRAKISLESHFERTRSELKKNSAQSGKDSWHIFCISFSRFFAQPVGRLLHCSPHHFNLSYLLKFWQSVYTIHIWQEGTGWQPPCFNIPILCFPSGFASHIGIVCEGIMGFSNSKHTVNITKLDIACYKVSCNSQDSALSYVYRHNSL